jgi:Fur family transcriptional regulator, ferric uptake regulator
MTKARQATLDILRSAQEPLSASAVLDHIGECCDQVTVYRSLHFLEESGLANSFVLHCEEHGTERYYTALDSPIDGFSGHHHWFHCEKCHRFLDLGDCQLHRLVEEYEATHQIIVKSHTLYFTGICSNCRTQEH